MAPITDDIIGSLKSLVDKLETRVQELESKLAGGNGSSSSTTTTPSGMRMVIMGPPGAGMYPLLFGMRTKLTRATGKGTQAPTIKEKFGICHLVRHPGRAAED